MLIVMLSFSAVVNAQRGRYNNNHSNHNRHYSYNYQNSYRHVPVRITTSYRYRPNYYYRTAYRPVYRPQYYRPAYRLPYYRHYGPAFGFRLSILPFGYSTVYVGRSPYYYNDGVYYRPYSNGGYEVTPPPIGAEVSRLPAGAKVIAINGEKYYELGGSFYQEEISTDNRSTYRVVGTDGVLNTGTGEQQYQPGAYNDNVAPVITPNDNAATVTTPKEYVAPVVGSRVDRLPVGSKVMLIDQQKYYLSAEGVYYQEVIEGNSVRYEVTGSQAN